ncbi:DUF2950 family protein [Edaphobacter sp. HDX4]|uniref:DUF2950 family protein n=1 Tax=Edaphobacter sp. HDX4 TaxID=2794064 RepID=UPI002FE6855B
MSAEEASQALYAAVRNNDDQAVQAILGAVPISTGNDGQDKLERERFAQKYKEMHRLVREADGSTVLYVGAENWPFPIPLVTTGGNWHFDSDSGSWEIMTREVGENETAVIKVCHGLTKASSSNAYRVAEDDAPVLEFVQSLIESEGGISTTSQTFHGYYFRVLKQRSGIAVVAYPATYGSSGVMTFLVSGSKVYERDLGPQTASMAQKIQGKPSEKWVAVQ